MYLCANILLYIIVNRNDSTLSHYDKIELFLHFNDKVFFFFCKSIAFGRENTKENKY